MSTNSDEDVTMTGLAKVVREWLAFAIAIVATVSGIIFWVQNASAEKFEHIEKEIGALRTDMKGIQNQNGEILRLVGQLEGKIEGLQSR